MKKGFTYYIISCKNLDVQVFRIPPLNCLFCSKPLNHGTNIYIQCVSKKKYSNRTSALYFT